MAVGRDQRMADMRDRLLTEFGATNAKRAVEVLTLMEFAWHDCYGEPAPAPEVVDDILVVAGGRLTDLISAALLAVIDRRDLKISADDKRNTAR